MGLGEALRGGAGVLDAVGGGVGRGERIGGLPEGFDGLVAQGALDRRQPGARIAHAEAQLHPVDRVGVVVGAGAVGVDDPFDLLGDLGQAVGVDLPGLVDEQLLAVVEHGGVQVAGPFADGLGDDGDLPGAEFAGQEGVTDLG
jgi:hypothetical protein